MSFRREPRTVPEKIAAIEEELRRLRTQLGISTGGTTALYSAKGDILVAVDAGIVEPVGVGPDGSVLTADSSAPEGVSWQGGSSDLLLWMGGL